MSGKHNQPAGTPTPRAKKAYGMRREGKTWEEIGAVLGVRPETARNYAGLMEKAGMDQLKRFHATPETVNPNVSAEMVNEALGLNGLDREKFMELAAKAGMPAKFANGLMKRVVSEYAGVVKEMKVLKGEALIEELHGKITKTLHYLNDEVLAKSAGRDLAVILGILIDKTQVLGGKPTAIYDVNVSHKIEVMMPQFMAEARRRGLTIDVTPGPIQVNEHPYSIPDQGEQTA